MACRQYCTTASQYRLCTQGILNADKVIESWGNSDETSREPFIETLNIEPDPRLSISYYISPRLDWKNGRRYIGSVNKPAAGLAEFAKYEVARDNAILIDEEAPQTWKEMKQHGRKKRKAEVVSLEQDNMPFQMRRLK